MEMLKEMEMKKYLMVYGGCRGGIDEAEIIESPLLLADLIEEYGEEAIRDVKDRYVADAGIDGYSIEEALNDALYEIEDMSIGGFLYEGGYGGVVFGEESYAYYVEVTEENKDLIEEFVEGDIDNMGEFLEFFGFE